jgi:fructose-bisphosphate aldolase class II
VAAQKILLSYETKLLSRFEVTGAMLAFRFGKPSGFDFRPGQSSDLMDILARAVGNMHGMLKSMVPGEMKEYLDIGRIAEITGATRILLTLHGGSPRFAIEPVEIRKIQPIFEAA